jgi:parallel beta-helix repeat protein
MDFSTLLKSQTIIPGGFVSGNWDSVNSPYLIRDNILIHPDSTLHINMGAIVLFSGQYRLVVQGQLLVSGTPSQPITFNRENDTITWGGIYFNTTDTSITDSSILQHGSISHCFQYSCLTIVNSSRLRVSSFIIENGLAYRGAGIYCSFSDPCFSDLQVRNNSALDGGGIALEGSAPVLKNCVITGNSADGAGGGMVIFDSSYLILENCIIEYNQSFGSGGCVYIYGSAPEFYSCLFTGNEGSVGASTLYSGGAVSVKLGSDHRLPVHIKFSSPPLVELCFSQLPISPPRLQTVHFQITMPFRELLLEPIIMKPWLRTVSSGMKIPKIRIR